MILTSAGLRILLLAVLGITGVIFYTLMAEEVVVAKEHIARLEYIAPSDLDLSDQTFSASLERQLIVPGQKFRSCRCMPWPYDRRVQYHATAFEVLEHNSFFAERRANRIVRHVSIYIESAAATDGGYGYCSAQPSSGNESEVEGSQPAGEDRYRNHHCSNFLEVGTTLDLLWQWSVRVVTFSNMDDLVPHFPCSNRVTRG